MRQLERLGHCTEVEVEIVPLSKVPPNVVQEMGLGDNKNQHQHHQQQRQQRKCEDLQTFENTKKHCKVQCRAELAQRQLSAKTEKVKSSTVKATSEHRHLCHSQHSHCFRGTNDHSNEITVIKHITESVCDESKSMITKGTESAPTSTCTSLTSISRSTTGANTATTCSTTTSFSLNGFNTYLSDQQLRTARMSNTMTVMAPCLRQPITTSTPTSDLAMRNFKWHFCCAERQHSSGKTCYSRADTNNTHKSVSGDHHHQQKCQSDLFCRCKHCDSSTAEDAASAKAASLSCMNSSHCLHSPQCPSTSSSASSCPASTSSHHHCLHYKKQTSTTAQSYAHSHDAGDCACQVHSTDKSNCLNNNCSRMEENEQDSDGDDEEELSSDNDNEEEDNEEEEEEEETKCNSNAEEDESEEEEEDNESEEDEEDDDDDEDEDEENLNCSATNNFPMRTIHHNHQRTQNSTMTDDEEDEETENQDEANGVSGSCLREVEYFACNVCDRTYRSARCLAKHQVHRRHFGCSICDTVFATLLSLEQHKHTLEHWSEDEEEDDDHSTVSLSLCASTSRHHCTLTGLVHQQQSNQNSSSSAIVHEHNHPVVGSNGVMSSHGYPSDALMHRHRSADDQVPTCRPGGAQKDYRPEETKLSLQSTTIAGQLEGKWSPRKENFSVQHLAGGPLTLNCINSSALRAHTSQNNNINGIDARCRTSHRVAVSTTNTIGKVTATSKPSSTPLSSLSSKLMASVFNFSSSNMFVDLETINSKTSISKQSGKQSQLNSQRLKSRSAEEMESLL